MIALPGNNPDQAAFLQKPDMSGQSTGRQGEPLGKVRHIHFTVFKKNAQNPDSHFRTECLENLDSIFKSGDIQHKDSFG